MLLKILHEQFSVCKVTDFHEINREEPFIFIGSTDEEKSLVCLTEMVPQNTTEREDGWKAFRVKGVLDFSLIGVLAKISTVLASGDVGILAISTFNTDYILTRSKDFNKAIRLLQNAGFIIEE